MGLRRSFLDFFFNFLPVVLLLINLSLVYTIDR